MKSTPPFPSAGAQLLSRALLLLVLVLVPLLVSLPAKASNAANLRSDNVAKFLLQTTSFLLGQKYEPESLTPAYYKEWALSDTANDDLVLATRQQIIESAGFKYTNHWVVSEDGYITQLIRIINPRADRDKLKGPPVMLLQGGISDQTIWIWGSIRQHHPERFPRTHEDGPLTSSNRSLAFTLANNGYDVWLVGTRGSNADNREHVKFTSQLNLLSSLSHPKSTNRATDPLKLENSDHGHRNLLERLRYWDYSMDEIATLELPLQIDKVLKLTGAQNVTLVPISFSGTYVPMTFAARPEYLAKLHNVAAIGPIVNSRGTNNFWHLFQRTACKLLPSELGNILANEILFNDAFRIPMGRMLRSRQLRYSLLKATSIVLNGASPMYQTFFEPAVYANIFLPTSFKEIKHFCQVVTAGRIQKYDFGPLQNHKHYGTLTPPKYDTSVIDFGNWLIVSAQNDALAPAASINDFISFSKTKPRAHISVPHYNHVDLIAAFDLDERVNLPVLKFLDQFHLAPGAGDRQHHREQEGDAVEKRHKDAADDSSSSSNSGGDRK